MFHLFLHNFNKISRKRFQDFFITQAELIQGCPEITLSVRLDFWNNDNYRQKPKVGVKYNFSD